MNLTHCRTEWIKLYGAMLNKEDAADSFFEKQAQVIEKLKGFENNRKDGGIFLCEYRRFYRSKKIRRLYPFHD